MHTNTYIILAIIFCALIFVNNIENFTDDIPIGIKHVRLGDFGGIAYVDNKPPIWRGEKSCVRSPCPTKGKYKCPDIFRDGIVCWKCAWIYDEPQND